MEFVPFVIGLVLGFGVGFVVCRFSRDDLYYYLVKRDIREGRIPSSHRGGRGL